MRTTLKSMMKAAFAAAAVVASAAALCPGTAHAQTGPESFIIGDKLFDSFTCLGANGLCDEVAWEPAPEGFGVRFNPALTLNADTSPDSSLDVLLGFRVSVVGGAARITDFLLTSNAAVSGTGSVVDAVEICTTATCEPGSVVFSGLLSLPPEDPGINIADFFLAGGPYSELWIFDDVAVSVGAAPGVASISRLDKIVTQTVPEPTSLVLIGSALLGMGLFRRRRNAARAA
jgi:hypothetical protein